MREVVLGKSKQERVQASLLGWVKGMFGGKDRKPPANGAEG